MKVVAIIQARMAATRLPGKVLVDVAGRPALLHVIERARSARTVDEVMVATSTDESNDPLERFCADHAIRCFRGSEEDVLDRYHRAATGSDADVVVRLTADCPLLDPEVVDKVVQTYLDGAFDYVSNTIDCTYPDGLDAEVIRRAALDRAWREARLQSEREHVTPYLRAHPELFRIENVRHETDLSAMRWTLDEPRDLTFIRAIYKHLRPECYGMAEVLKVLRDHPEISTINQGIARNEGYTKSVREDHPVEAPRDP